MVFDIPKIAPYKMWDHTISTSDISWTVLLPVGGWALMGDLLF